MKICLFADAQSIHIQQLAPGLAKLGHDVHIVTHKPAEVPGATVERFAVPDPGVTNLRGWAGRRAAYLRGFLRRFDVVNVHFLQDWGFRFDPPIIENAALVATAWGSDIIDPPGETPAPPELTQTRQTLLRRADAVTVCGPTFAKTVAEYAGVSEDHVDVLPFGVDLNIFQSADHRAAGHHELPRIGFFKGFRPVYGATTLVHAIPAVLQEIPSARFDFVGDGVELARCQDLASELGVAGSIDWIPRQPHERLPQWLTRCDLTVIPSVHEAFGVAALESAAMGVPVVASDVCGLRDTVRHRETGLLVPPCDSEALAEAIVELLHNQDLRDRMGRAGRDMVQSLYDWSDLHGRWARFYEQVRERMAVMV